ncbi:uncharacterized protein LY79DRAFT_659968 [Colletotrichum navitas]|uniref:Uncharacterized protein n=1 Tax=Colletotrichum navitas TaxID=681940 RepID=A0AAD8V3Y8_9PEZI|nr:uncharacterized protein LY79DRAFT_659968 [Colletotrichum navitas]KAK1589832.1 hypothetical protein LY79DRAFT_659968 [Colletotrichum navitas]
MAGRIKSKSIEFNRNALLSKPDVAAVFKEFEQQRICFNHASASLGGGLVRLDTYPIWRSSASHVRVPIGDGLELSRLLEQLSMFEIKKPPAERRSIVAPVTDRSASSDETTGITDWDSGIDAILYLLIANAHGQAMRTTGSRFLPECKLRYCMKAPHRIGSSRQLGGGEGPALL